MASTIASTVETDGVLSNIGVQAKPAVSIPIFERTPAVSIPRRSLVCYRLQYMLHIQLQQTRYTPHATRHTHAVVALPVVALSAVTFSYNRHATRDTLHATRTL